MSTAVSDSSFPENGRGLKICVLQPDYSTSDVDYQYYDPPRDLSHLLPEAEFEHVFLNKLTTYKQLSELKKKGFDIFVNLCEGYLHWTIPSVDAYYFMELLNLPFTGPGSLLYDPPKELMKYVAFTEGIKTPAYAIVNSAADVAAECGHLQYPLFVKPAKAGDSLGVDEKSLVYDEHALIEKINAIAEEYAPLLVEEYIEGREFTAMIVADAHDHTAPRVFKPIEYIFPEGYAFKTYAIKTSALHPKANVPVTDPLIEEQLKNAAKSVFRGFNGKGYARMDFRMNDKGELFFLEINFTCSVFYSDGYEGSADYILKEDGVGQKGFLELIIAEGMARHRRAQKPYRLKGTPQKGYGIFAVREIHKGEITFKGEEMAQRIVTRRNVETTWTPEAATIFRKYAYPLSEEVFILWDNDPNGWAPQNHSCNPTTGYDGLNVVALRDIHIGEELTFDYATFLDENMEPFECHCGAPNCRKYITGVKGNSINHAELLIRQNKK